MTTFHRDFKASAEGEPKKREAPFSLRLTPEELERVEEAANGMPLGAYIKAVLFSQDLQKVRRRTTTPTPDHETPGRVLAALGQSRLSSNLNQLARAVNTGTLPVHPEIEDELREACDEVAAMRADLIRALGLESGPS